MRRYQLLKESLVATLLVLITVMLINHFPFKAELAKLFKQELKDFDIYDLHFTGSNLSKNSRDTNIVLIQTANSRKEIADQLSLLDSLEPAVIGLDVSFPDLSKDSLGDFYLNKIIHESNRVVIASTLEEQTPGQFSNRSSYFIDPGNRIKEGYINFIGDQYSVLRSFAPFAMIRDTVYNSFAASVTEKFDNGRFSALKKRRKKIELINYSGNLESYYNFNIDQLHSYNQTNQLLDKVKNKIVLVGFFKSAKKDEPLLLEDMHFTPLNERMNGKSYPDMYGVVVHANIISMILKGKYIKQVSKFTSYLLSGIFTFFLLLYMLFCHRKKKAPGHARFVLLQIFLLILLIYFFLLLFSYYRIKTPLLPVILSLALAVEMFGAYKYLAKWMNKKWGYITIFTKYK